MRKRYYALLMLVLLLFSAGCQRQWSRELFSMDTWIKLTVSGKNADAALDACEAELFRLESLFSVTREGSDAARINWADGDVVSVCDDVRSLLLTAGAVSKETGGAFDVSVYPLVSAWGFSGDRQRVPEQAELDAILPLVGMDRVHLSEDGVQTEPGTQVDFGGIAKGYASARLAEIAASYGIKSALFTLGGNVQAVGNRPDGTAWRIGIMDPSDSERVIGALSVSDCAVITAGGYQRFFEQDGVTYHHILDPKTGYPADAGLRSVTVVARDGARADALSTALFVMGEAAAIDLYRASDDFDFIIVTSDDRILVTEGLAFQPEEEGKVVAIRKNVKTGA